ncbi:PAS domain S-box protein [Tenacibaculum sediminilitoris]|uniref:PAS domain-containing sensor histidine kinase n=1 Tax=Tenacibaculum sediminilitoris TaxID=1820334 RepID=UPI003893F050
MEIKHNELSFQLMVEATPTALIVVNNYGKIAYLNNFSEKLFLYKKNELIGQDIGILIPQNKSSNHPAYIKEFFVNPKSRQMGENRELYALKKNGVTFPVEIGLNPLVTVDGTLVLAAIIDISDRKKADEQFRLVVESAPNAMIMVDNRGLIIMINKQTELLFGYSRDELIGQKMELLVPDRFKENHSNHRTSFYKKPTSRAMGAGRDLFALKKDGIEIPIEIGLNLIPKKDSQFVLASIIDITERKKNEEAFKEYTKSIEHKNQELEQFTYIASHDLSEPLNSIQGLISLIMDDEENNIDENLIVKLNFMDQSVTRMKELIKGLLDYARLGKNVESVEVDFNLLVKNVLSDLESSIKKHEANIIVENLPKIKAYELEIHLLFQNLISNAIKYRNSTIPPKIHISAKHVNNLWQFAIRDNGIGIPLDQKDKIFLLFQRLHARNEYSGVGIGLAHCKKIVELHNGNIWADSEVGKGSIFYFTLAVK